MPLAVGIRCIMCHEVAGEQHEASLHTAHTAAISDSVVAGHCVSPMSCAVIGHSFPESQETCTNKKSSGIKCAKSIMSVVCVCVCCWVLSRSFALACGLRRCQADRRKWKAQQITPSVWSCGKNLDFTCRQQSPKSCS